MDSQHELDNFMKVTERSTTAVVIPLFGFWSDIPHNPVNGEILNIALRRVYSQTQHLYLIFVANPQTVDNDPTNPESLANVLLARAQGGNTKHVPVERSATYPEYIVEGIRAALETNARFVSVFNPWIWVQEGGFDSIIERCNRGDDANVVSGNNVRAAISIDDFDRYQSSTPAENWDINLDFMCMPRFMAEIIQYDPNYKTKPFFQMDMFQQTRYSGFASIVSERVPIFPFDFPWTSLETREMFEVDRAYFKNKWGFDCGLKYEENEPEYERKKSN